MGKYKSRAVRFSEALSKIEEGMSEIESLTEEMESWAENMEGTNLENTEKYTTVSECAEALREGFDYLENAKSDLDGVVDGVEFPSMLSTGPGWRNRQTRRT